MKYILIMQLVLDIYQGGGATIETLQFDNKASCEKVMEVFLKDMKVTGLYDARIYRQAKCIPVKGE